MLLKMVFQPKSYVLYLLSYVFYKLPWFRNYNFIYSNTDSFRHKSSGNNHPSNHR